MNAPHLQLVHSHIDAGRQPHPNPALEASVHQAIQAGFHIGRKVRIGRVRGHIVGYNIGHAGRYDGIHYPLLVSTEFGVAKCSLNEVCGGGKYRERCA